MRIVRGALCRLAVLAPRLVRFLPVTDSLRAEYYPSPHRAGDRDLLVLLPGIADSPRDFSRRGFVEELHGQALPIDVVSVDTHYGYYARRSVAERLHQDVIAPAREIYRRLWLGGISLGGFGALYYASRYPTDVSGVIAMAPFLGRQPLLDEIGRAGGLHAWRTEDLDGDPVRVLWTWLKRQTQTRLDEPSLYLAYGERDTFAAAHRLLAGALPPERIFVEPGGHEWKTWRRLWTRVVRSSVWHFS